MKKILLIDIGSPYGGVEAYIEALTRLLKGRAEIFAICALPVLADALRNQGVKVLCIPLLSGWAKGLRFLTTLLALPYMVVRYRIDIVQVNGYLESVLLLPARALGCEAICTRHGPFETELYRWYTNPARFFPRILCRYFIHCATRVICVSEAVEQSLQGIIPAERVTVVSNWVKNLPGMRTRSDLHTPAKLLYVGRLERYKGLHLLLAAMRGLTGVQLTVLGEGSYKRELMEMAAGLDVRFEGFCADTSPYYEAADVFINPSFGPEGLPIVSLECMAHGTPSIFSNLPVHLEISDRGRAALLFEVGNADSLREKIIAVLGDLELRYELSENARAIVEAKYSPDAARGGYLRAFGLASSVEFSQAGS